MNKNILMLVCVTLLSSCSQLPQGRNGAKKLVIKNFLSQEGPIDSPDRSAYPVSQNLPGNPFVDHKTIRSLFTYDSKGRLILSTGDYIFPVMTYCMNSSASSPAGHIYSLSKLEGKRAKIIRELNLLAPAKYFSDEIQMVSWGLQNGLSYEELGRLGQEIVDSVIPHYKSELQESLLTQIEKKWNQAQALSGGMLPSFSSSMENLEDNLGELGKRIQEMREFRKRLREFGYDYAQLSELIDTTTRSELRGDTPWSQISTNVYARFVTEESFGGIGYIQVRVLPNNSGHEINSETNKQEVLDLVSLLANPNSRDIQPLSFSPLYGFGGTITLTPALSRHPLAAALLLASLLSAKYVDWEAFFNIQDLLQDVNDRDVQKEIGRGLEAIRKEHDILEKPLKEAGIITGKDKETTLNKKGRVREYRKSGGREQRQKDFDKIEGEFSKAKDGTETKVLPDGTTVVKRPDEVTIEVQAPEGDSRYPLKGTKVKVRYP